MSKKFSLTNYQKKLIVILIPTIVFLVLYLLWDEIKPSEEVKQESIVFADTNFIDGNESVEVKTTTEKRVDLLREKYNRENVTAAISRKVVSHIDFFGTGVIEEEVDEILDVKEDTIEVPTAIEKTKIVYVQNKVYVPKAKEKPLKRRTRKKDAMFNSGKDLSISTAPDINKVTMVSAVVHGDYSIRAGQNITLRLTDDIVINGEKIYKNSYISAKTYFTNGRVGLEIGRVTVNGKIVSVNTKIFDVYDNQEGIYVPEGVEKEIKDNLVNDGINETARRINVPGIGSFEIGSKKKAKDPVIKIGSGHKLLIKFL